MLYIYVHCAHLAIGYLELSLIRIRAAAGEPNAYLLPPAIHVDRVYVRPTEASAVGWVPQLERSVVRNPLKVGTDQSVSSGTR